MTFERILPCAELEHLVQSYWIIQDNSRDVHQQKIIPDGYPEIIFHFGDAYRINITGSWCAQTKSLLAGQLTRHFHLQNTGPSDMVGIKLQPTAVTHLFGISMDSLTDRVVDLHETMPGVWRDCEQQLNNIDRTADRIRLIETFLKAHLPSTSSASHPANIATRHILERHGMVTVQELTELLSISERALQQHFKKFVGLPPKLYARIVRFNYVFEIISNKPANWMDVVVAAGYYDQSHFIRNFRDFTGEEPGAYGFNEATMANFFLKK